jgi:hypothetical protein
MLPGDHDDDVASDTRDLLLDTLAHLLWEY